MRGRRRASRAGRRLRFPTPCRPPLWVIVPTYDEAASIERLLRSVAAVLAEAAPGDHRILVVDDGSPDGTGAIAERVGAELGVVEVLHRPAQGRARSGVPGRLRHALAAGAQRVVRDGRRPLARPGAPARAAGGGRARRRRARLALRARRRRDRLGRAAALRSATAAAATRASILGLPQRDLTGGYKVLQPRVLEAIELDSVRSQGYVFQIEVTYRAVLAGFRVEEVPIVFRERDAGTSKMSARIALEAMWRVPRLRRSAPAAVASRARRARGCRATAARRSLLPMDRTLRLLSVVAPVFDEEELVEAFYARVCAALEGIPFELVLVDDGSQRPHAASCSPRWPTRDPRVRVIQLSRNFGHQTALTAGLDHARGDAVVMIDADLQDPPELIPEMLDHWRRGTDVVYAVRQPSARARRASSSRPRAGSTSCSASSRDVDARARLGRLPPARPRARSTRCSSMRERNRFLRGMTVWVGFTQTAVPYERDARHAGETKYTLRTHAALLARRDLVVLAPAAAARDAASASSARRSRSCDPGRDRAADRRLLPARASARSRSRCCCSAASS